MLSLTNISKTYQIGASQLDALTNINLEIQKGEFLVLFGHSGSGKSTLLNLIAGLDQPTRGKIIFNGQNLATYNDLSISSYRREHIGFVFQDFNLHSHLTVEENIALPLIFSKKKNSVEKIMKQVNIFHRRSHYPAQLSGGEKQRTALGRALINDPDIILGDEPTGNLDKKNTDDILKLIKKLHLEKNITLILATHKTALADLADRFVELKEGHLIS